MNVFLDIETIPAQSPEFLAQLLEEATNAAEQEAASVTPPANYKSADTIEKWWEETGNAKRASIIESAASSADEQYRKTSLDGAYGQIAVIGFAINDEEPQAFYVQDYDHPDAEPSVISEFYACISSKISGRDPMTFVGHHLIGFDLRFLLQRSYVTNTRPPVQIPFRAKPWEQDKVFDTMTEWAGVGKTIRLDKLCNALGVKGKTEGIDGSKVWDFVKAGRIAEVAEYCKDDVRAARSCYYRMNFCAQKAG